METLQNVCTGLITPNRLIVLAMILTGVGMWFFLLLMLAQDEARLDQMAYYFKYGRRLLLCSCIVTTGIAFYYRLQTNLDAIKATENALHFWFKIAWHVIVSVFWGLLGNLAIMGLLIATILPLYLVYLDLQKLYNRESRVHTKDGDLVLDRAGRPIDNDKCFTTFGGKCRLCLPVIFALVAGYFIFKYGRLLINWILITHF